MNDAIKMQLSAFVDDELPDNESELLLRRISQDAELRAEVANYLSIGRVMRNDSGLAGADRLHERVLAALDSGNPDTEQRDTDLPKRRSIRPLAGVAAAAVVAVAAIVALQWSAVEPAAVESPAVAEAAGGETVPSVDAQQERQRRLLENHRQASSALGANGINTRLVTLEFSDVVEVDPEEDEDGNAAVGDPP